MRLAAKLAMVVNNMNTKQASCSEVCLGSQNAVFKLRGISKRQIGTSLANAHMSIPPISAKVNKLS